MKKLTIVTLIISSWCGKTFAQYGDFDDYVGGSFFRGNLEVPSSTIFGGVFNLPQSTDFDLNILDLRLGVEMLDWLHIEGRVAYGLNDKSSNGIEFSINRMAGVYGVLRLPNQSKDDLIRPYALAGVTYGEVDFLIPGIVRDRETETDLSYGIGTNIGITNSIDLFVEFMQYLDKNGLDFSGIGVGVKFDF